jgi:hypothetical protein
MLTGSLKKERGRWGNAGSQSTRSPCALVASSASHQPVLGIDQGFVQGFLSLSRARADDEFVLSPSLGKLMVNPKLGRSRRRFALRGANNGCQDQLIVPPEISLTIRIE